MINVDDVTRHVPRSGQEGFVENGFAFFSREDCPFTSTEWARLRELSFSEGQFELVTCGDTSEPTSVLVHRLLIDGNPPRVFDPTRADELIRIIGSPAKLGFLERVIRRTNLMVRRAQAHILEEGGYIACHRDSESSKHYVAAVVLQFRAAEEGGEFVIGRMDGDRMTLPVFSMLITDAELPHEVTPVLRGERRSLVFWLADVSSP
jgi:hypothetical protein